MNPEPEQTELPLIVDTHCHLDWNKFDGERDAIVERAREAGVTRMITIGTDVESSRAALALADRFEGVFAAVGIHPCDTQNPQDEDWLGQIAELAEHPKVVAIGEIGLDYYHPPRVKGLSVEDYYRNQAEFCRRQLELAEALALPVVIHQRGDCYHDLLETIRPFSGKLRAVFHCWTHPPELADPVLEMGHFVSFTGVVSFPKATEVHAAARSIPADRYMVETDAPFLAPAPHRGKRCEPAFTSHTATAIANLRGSDPTTVAIETTANAERFFRGIGE